MISIRKINALFTKQLKIIMHNPFILVSLFITPLLAVALGRIEPDEGMGFMGLFSLLLMMNTMIGGSFMMSCLIAEEKEKNTLNVLITSTVSVWDFLISNLLVALIFTMGINVFLYLFLGITEYIGLGQFFLISASGAIVAAVLGASLGLGSKNQMTASTLCTPLLFIPMLPLFLPDNIFTDRVLYYFFTEQIHFMLTDIMDGEFKIYRMAIVAANFIVFSLVFAMLYKKRGLGVE
jgi:ABC-2 type transport system permease protein